MPTPSTILAAPPVSGEVRHLPKLHEGLLAADYHAMTGASASRLKDFARSPAHARYAMDNPSEPTPAMRLGTAIHSAVLEPRSFVHYYRVAERCCAKTLKGDQCSNSGSAFMSGKWFCGRHLPDGWEQDSRVAVVSQQEWDTCNAIAESLMAHPAARVLLYETRVHTELSATWTDQDSGVPCKMRADAVCDIDGEMYLPDLKTTEDASEEGFWKAMSAYRYDLSGAHYTRGLAIHGIAIDYVCLVMVEKTPPHAVGVYRIPQEVLAAADEYRAGLLARWAECERSGAWPAFSDEMTFPVPPVWFMRKHMDKVLTV